MRTRSIFKSRWMALIWAAGFLWFAYDVAESQPQADGNVTNAEATTDVSGAPVTSEEQNQVAGIIANL